MLETFDIFETCLVRRVAVPSGVFGEMGRRLGMGEDFRFLRVEAEREAREREGDEIGLEAIYRVLGEWYAWDETMAKDVMEAELSEEARQLVAVPELIQRVGDARRRGATIAYLSDMYLPSSFLEGRLREHGFFQDGDLLWVSGECGDSKAHGALYERVKRETSESHWRHWGNHPHSDVSMAQRHGLETGYFPEGNLNRYEERMMEWARRGISVAESWAGAARLARLRAGGSSVAEKALAKASSGVAGPMVLGFAGWLVDRAMAYGVDDVYFLARDGQVLMAPFEAVAKARGLSLKARYLYASRISLRFPKSFPMSEAAEAGVFQTSHGKIPLAVVAARLGVAECELRKWLPSDCVRVNELLADKVEDAKKALSAEKVVEHLRCRAEERSELLRDYLAQEGLSGREHALVVDLGWAGSLQIGLQETLAASGAKTRLTGLYFGLAHAHGKKAESLDAETFLFDSRRGDRVPVGSWMTTTTETLCQADHGSTLGFERGGDGRVRPVFDREDGTHPGLPDWLELHRKVITSFVDAALESGGLPAHAGSLKAMLMELLLDFWARPKRDEAEVWGDLLFASGGVASDACPLGGKPGGLRDLVWIMGSGVLGYGRTLWREGAAARLPRPMDRLAVLLRKVKRTEAKRFARSSYRAANDC